MITRTRVNINLAYNARELSPSMEETLKYAASAYGFLLPRVGKPYHFAEFARIIAKHYDPQEPHNAEVIRVLRAVDGLKPLRITKKEGLS